ncbi:MAG: CopG family transcriptional regulator [Oscillochloridaceae bacterium umkhey_bin13]
MRTTVDLEEDVLLAAKALARQRGVSIGRVLSDLVRQALASTAPGSTRNSLPLFPIQPNARVVTPELINQLRDEQL